MPPLIKMRKKFFSWYKEEMILAFCKRQKDDDYPEYELDAYMAMVLMAFFHMIPLFALLSAIEWLLK